MTSMLLFTLLPLVGGIVAVVAGFALAKKTSPLKRTAAPKVEASHEDTPQSARSVAVDQSVRVLVERIAASGKVGFANITVERHAHKHPGPEVMIVSREELKSVIGETVRGAIGKYKPHLHRAR